jgi:hypothetical protein
MVTVRMLAPGLDGFNSAARAIESVSNTAGHLWYHMQ